MRPGVDHNRRKFVISRSLRPYLLDFLQLLSVYINLNYDLGHLFPFLSCSHFPIGWKELHQNIRGPFGSTTFSPHCWISLSFFEVPQIAVHSHPNHLRSYLLTRGRAVGSPGHSLYCNTLPNTPIAMFDVQMENEKAKLKPNKNHEFRKIVIQVGLPLPQVGNTFTKYRIA